MERIIIDPVTRIEGHARISILLDEEGKVSEARFHVTEFRGFEKFCQGRPFWEMAGLSARICGICPVSHLLASSRAGDALLGIRVPPAAEKLRRLMNLGQFIQSHALSFFHLSAPDLLLGWDSPPQQRNVFGLIAANRDLARAGIRLRQFGQEVIELLGGRKIHPAWSVPGGVREPLTPQARDQLLRWLPEVRQTVQTALAFCKRFLDEHPEEIRVFGHFPSLFLALVQPNGNWEHHDGLLVVVDSTGQRLAELSDPHDYASIIGEHVEPDSYLKSPFYRPFGYPAGLYRVGPLARLNVCTRMGTPLADAELHEFRQRAGRIAESSFLYHHARLIEIVAAIELVERLLDDPELQTGRIRAEASINRQVGVGISEAPRGTLFHHYEIDEDGLLKRVNLIIATGQNNLAMNRTITQIAQHYIRGKNLPEGMLNRVEAGIRAFDPCLSCSTHAVGKMALHVQLFDARGNVVDEVWR
jgi:NAD-reducing hydrogenase large subunit